MSENCCMDIVTIILNIGQNNFFNRFPVLNTCKIACFQNIVKVIEEWSTYVNSFT